MVHAAQEIRPVWRLKVIWIMQHGHLCVCLQKHPESGIFYILSGAVCQNIFCLIFLLSIRAAGESEKKKKKINGIRVIPWVTVMQFVHTNKVIGFWLGIHFSLVQVLVKHLVYIILHCLNSNCTMCGGQNEELFALAVMG